MAATKELKAQARSLVGKGAARELRRQGKIPAVIYGNKKPPVTISIAYKDAMKSIYSGGFLSHILTLDVEGEKHQVIPRDYQLDPVKDFAMHVDFLRVGKGTKLNVQVHVNFINEEASPGLKRGGTLNIVHHTLDLNVSADNIPEEITVDLTGLEIGDTVHMSSITLPKGVLDHSHEDDATIATIVAPSALKSSGDADAEADEADAAAEEADEDDKE
ncbi:50S ribosomal protein L25/general stress protein Ctc [Devosia rhodophyticola]|uniref:Large ribosomal subunit protein bL25 n=1 Tax=Devosia rhodophyticola TaxID=3026423 RepID=A0ABY7YUN4_9HYPH|nr:50S ribosomal protein L25/general stress protein Ctc [Devosia rhodophyticola]WDR05073.1 50S ribosomal protein L25/general stress protein Ctc [Devosia rhodophyticola]